jgi:hypothetical protein
MAMNWAYVAGFFDGEGNIRMEMGSERNSVQAQIIQAGDIGNRVLEEIRSFIAQSGIQSKVHHRSARYANRLPVHVLYTGSVHAEKFLANVFPYLRVKKTHAQDVLRIRKMFPPGRGGVRYPAMVERRCKTDEKVKRWL